MAQFNRTFKMWDYWVSHSQLLLRSPGDLREPKGSSESRNIDIIFLDVDYIELPAIMCGLELASDATAEELSNVKEIIGDIVSPERMFVLISKGRRHLVVAGGMWVRENDLELMETSLDRGPYGRDEKSAKPTSK
jgi:hypothetical protein